MKLLLDYVLIEPITSDRSPSGAIHYPAQYESDTMHWRVLGVGPGRKNKKGHWLPMEVGVGDEVVAPSYHGPKATMPTGQRVISQDDILLVVSRSLDDLKLAQLPQGKELVGKLKNSESSMVRKSAP